VKKPSDPPDKYVEAFAGGDIQTNPPATNEAVEKSARSYSRQIDEMPSAGIQSEIDRSVDMLALERVLMEEGIRKFVEPQSALLRLIAQTRASLHAGASSNVAAKWRGSDHGEQTEIYRPDDPRFQGRRRC
jgi:transaldolase